MKNPDYTHHALPVQADSITTNVKNAAPPAVRSPTTRPAEMSARPPNVGISTRLFLLFSGANCAIGCGIRRAVSFAMSRSAPSQF